MPGRGLRPRRPRNILGEAAIPSQPKLDDLLVAGGGGGDADFEGLLAGFAARHAWPPPALAPRYARAYGTPAERVVGAARNPMIGRQRSG